MAQERIETRLIRREDEDVVAYDGPLELRAPVDHVRKLLEERISLGRRLAVLLVAKDFQWRDALQRLKTWNAFNATELGRFIASPEAVSAYNAAVRTPDASVPEAERAAAYRAVVHAPLGILMALYERLPA